MRLGLRVGAHLNDVEGQCSILGLLLPLLEHFARLVAQRWDLRTTSQGTAAAHQHERLPELLVHAIDQQPGAAVAHLQFACRCSDAARASDVLFAPGGAFQPDPQMDGLRSERRGVTPEHTVWLSLPPPTVHVMPS